MLRTLLGLALRTEYFLVGGGETMAKVETNARKIIDRLKADGWINIGGGRHDRFIRKDRPEMMIAVPRHRELTSGVARSIAKAAGWLRISGAAR
jgi:predicted RNA binding protein YcfA (HicA-like mRNA interferase family)